MKLMPNCRSSLPEVFYKKVVLKNFAKFTGKHLCQSLFLIKLQALGLCFPVNFAKFLRTPFFIEHLWWLLLKLCVNTAASRNIPYVCF